MFWEWPGYVLALCKPNPRRLEMFEWAFIVALWQSVGCFSQAQITKEEQNEERFNSNLEFVLAFVHGNT